VLTNRQKMLVHIYRDAADLADADYRALLQRHTGCRSAADPQLDQGGFDALMAGLELVLFQRLDAGQVDPPLGRSRWISSRDYWRRKVSLSSQGYLTSRQYHRIRALWTSLAPRLGLPQPSTESALLYLRGIIQRATGRANIGAQALTSAEAAAVIDALQDRLLYAVKHANSGSIPV